MPGITTFPEQPKDVEDLLTEERKKRADEMELAWSYYFGEHRPSLKVPEGQPDDNVILNVSGKLVNQGVDMLFGRGLEMQLDEVEDTEQEKRLAEIWEANRQEILLHDIALNGFVTGQPAVKIVPVEGKDPRIINLNPAIVSVFWELGDIESVLAYVLAWNNRNRQYVVKDESDAAWWIRDYKLDGHKWTRVDEQKWEWPWPPVMDWKNRPNPNRYYGRSDLSHADLNDRINFVASNTNRIIELHAHPKTIAKGVTAEEIVETSVGGLYSTPNENADIYNLEMKGDLASSMAFLNMLRGEFYSEGGGVDLASMKDKVGQLTNFGLRVLYKDAIGKMELKRLLYGEALVEISRRLLDVVGMGDDNKPVIHWPEPLPENQLENVESLAIEDALGVVSKATMAADLGRDWEVEQVRMVEEGEAEGDLGTLLLRNFEQGRG